MSLILTSVSSVSSVVNNSRGPMTTEDTKNHVFHGLASNEVHVWRIPLNQSPAKTLPLERVLSADEREKAARFYFDKDRRQFVQARAALRFILSQYLQVDPQTLEFAYGPQGKKSWRLCRST
jgi:hypothetical protein